jgi:hypothetical protein
MARWWICWQVDHKHAAIQLEMLWNQLATTRRLSLLCRYARGQFSGDPGSIGYSDVCGSTATC